MRRSDGLVEDTRYDGESVGEPEGKSLIRRTKERCVCFFSGKSP